MGESCREKVADPFSTYRASVHLLCDKPCAVGTENSEIRQAQFLPSRRKI